MSERTSLAQAAPVLDAKEARDHFADALGRASHGKQRVIIRKHKKPVAALVPIEDLRRLEAIEEEADRHTAQRRLRAWKKNPSSAVALTDVARRLKIKV